MDVSLRSNKFMLIGISNLSQIKHSYTSGFNYDIARKPASDCTATCTVCTFYFFLFSYICLFGLCVYMSIIIMYMYYVCVCTCIFVHTLHGQNKEFCSALQNRYIIILGFKASFNSLVDVVRVNI